MVSPPSKSQVAVISIICLSVTLGYPKSRKDSAALLNRAVGAGSPLNWGVLLKCLPNSSATHLTATVSGPVTFKSLGGEEQCNKERIAISLASLCQITLTNPVDKSMTCSFNTDLAISSKTPYRKSIALFKR